jgi:hypothetical protein
MVTLRSNKNGQKWIGEARVFSGRPDPTWEIAPEVVGELQELWESLEPCSGPLPQSPIIGYRGCILKAVGYREFFAYGGIVTLRAFGTVLCRRDEQNQFEKKLLSSAPPDMIPVWAVEARVE